MARSSCRRRTQCPRGDLLVLNDGVITFEGGIDALLASGDDYISHSLEGGSPPSTRE